MPPSRAPSPSRGPGLGLDAILSIPSDVVRDLITVSRPAGLALSIPSVPHDLDPSVWPGGRGVGGGGGGVRGRQPFLAGDGDRAS